MNKKNRFDEKKIGVIERATQNTRTFYMYEFGVERKKKKQMRMSTLCISNSFFFSTNNSFTLKCGWFCSILIGSSISMYDMIFSIKISFVHRKSTGQAFETHTSSCVSVCLCVCVVDFRFVVSKTDSICFCDKITIENIIEFAIKIKLAFKK